MRSTLKFLTLNLIALATLLLPALVVFGQTDAGRIVGIVKDQNGAIIPGATVGPGIIGRAKSGLRLQTRTVTIQLQR